MGKLVNSAGEIPFGILKKPAGEINYQDYPLRDPFRRLLAVEERHRRFVHFHFIGFTSKAYIGGCSLTLVGNEKTAFFYLFDRKDGSLLKKGLRLTDPAEGKITLDPDDGISSLSRPGFSVTFTANKDSMSKSLTVDAGDELSLRLSFSETEDQFETLRLTTPTGPNGWTYCQKVAGIHAQGELTFQGNHIDLSSQSLTAHHDFTAGFLRPDTFWNWACITGVDTTGNLIGLNVSNGVNETGWSENRIWIDGKSHEVGLFAFTYDPDDLEKPWLITSEEGSRLTFTAEGKYAAMNDKIQTAFDFHQLFGHFDGIIRTSSGAEIEIQNLPGFCERQYAIWWI
ncbi:DUF2804 domain-containing protein [Sneathiella limimaris]|uniref:DUF2804 domain-containing protein n=1 Tax=Sneathiella limimaris TaxID=1964213 RepID=UPI00146A0180|nr:DUF2804 domain-containing protein [Sneathiella limimaris]